MYTFNPIPPTLTEQDRVRFWSKVAHANVTDCWLWQGSIQKGNRPGQNYGYFCEGKYRGRTLRAHRVAFLFVTDEWPPLLMHTCDNPPCVNPLHLRPGTYQENILDSHAKGRWISPKGQQINTCRLTPTQVITIRTRLNTGESLASLGREYGVTLQAIYLIKKGKNWKHLL